MFAESFRLRVVDRIAVALFADGFLHLFQMPLLAIQSRLHALGLLLLFPLPLIPLHAARSSAFVVRKMDRLIQAVNLLLQRCNLSLLRLNLRLPAFRRLLGCVSGGGA